MLARERDDARIDLEWDPERDTDLELEPVSSEEGGLRQFPGQLRDCHLPGGFPFGNLA